MKKEEKIFAERLQAVISQKLAIACRICGITVGDTTSGRKHINYAGLDGKAAYIYAERNIALVVITFKDNRITVRRIRRGQYWRFMALYYLKSFFGILRRLYYDVKFLSACRA